MFGWFKKKQRTVVPPVNEYPPLYADMHSHLLPGIDDGSQSMEESVEMIREFARQGYRKLITTPHIMADFYRNTPEIIYGKRDEVRAKLVEEGIDMEFEAAAEYYLDEGFVNKLRDGEALLTFGDKHLLFETSYMAPAPQIHEVIFELQIAGYKPVLAHPERYQYLFDDFEEIEKIHDKGVLLQVNAISLGGYYSKPSQKLAEKLIDRGMVSFLASDCHKMKHLAALEDTRPKEYFYKALQHGLHNNQLVTDTQTV